MKSLWPPQNVANSENKLHEKNIKIDKEKVHFKLFYKSSFQEILNFKEKNSWDCKKAFPVIKTY